MDTTATRQTYLLVDGENIDATLGNSVFGGRKPAPDERPRWERVHSFSEQYWSQSAKGLFFLNASSGTLPISFVHALLALHWRPIPLSGPAGMKVVDVGIQRTLEAIVGRPADVILGSHDVDFLPQVSALLEEERRVAILGFPEFVNNAYLELVPRGLEILDMEQDAHAFNKPLPRVRILDIEEFDPLAFL